MPLLFDSLCNLKRICDIILWNMLFGGFGMNRVFFDLGVFLYWSADSMASKSVTSKGSVIVSNKDALKAIMEENAVMDPDILDVLKSLRKEGFSLNICDSFSQAEIWECVEKLGIDKYFDEYVSTTTEEAMASAFAEKRGKDDFFLFVGTNEMIIRVATKMQIPSICYGKDWMSVYPMTFSKALYPIEIEDQIRITLLVHSIVKKAILKKSKILGIDGIMYAGKKTLADRITRYMDLIGQENMIVDLEDYHRAVEESYKGEDPVEAYYFNGFNYEKLMEDVLDPYLKEGKLDRTVYCLDSYNDAFVNERYYKISENGIMILLGTMMYREPLLKYFDTTVYLRVDDKEAEHRASLMDVPVYGLASIDDYKKKDIPAEKMYVARHDPFRNRDFVIDNSNYHRPFFID